MDQSNTASAPPAATDAAPPPTLDPPALLITADMLATPKPREMRIDFERGMSYLPRLTILLVIANLGVFAAELAYGSLDSPEAIIAAGALHRASVLDGQIWRLFTAIFLHASWEHIIGNCLILYILGMACEHALGWMQTALAYLLSGLSGSLLSVIMSPGPGVGASGAIFGLLGCLIVFLYRHQRMFFVRDKQIGYVLLAWAVWQVSIGFLSPEIDNFAHIGGFCAGATIALLLHPRLAHTPTPGFDVIPLHPPSAVQTEEADPEKTRPNTNPRGSAPR